MLFPNHIDLNKSEISNLLSCQLVSIDPMCMLVYFKSYMCTSAHLDATFLKLIVVLYRSRLTLSSIRFKAERET